ncbi:hypothetical protein QO011_004176 [Labrys wisconsinensis]|uniref:Uncharacterized protein n=1 Tax=Labrys wisconsinensis TaxID=425677 RepID=A0ABU0JA67_9HYPH|nr:hypothetical protein [Labrys wisconsinensis]
MTLATIGWLVLATLSVSLGFLGHRVRIWAALAGSERHRFRQALKFVPFWLFMIASPHLPFVVPLILIALAAMTDILICLRARRR